MLSNLSCLVVLFFKFLIERTAYRAQVEFVRISEDEHMQCPLWTCSMAGLVLLKATRVWREPCCGKTSTEAVVPALQKPSPSGEAERLGKVATLSPPYSYREQRFSQVVSGCRCTTVTFTQTPGLLHLPLQGTPLPLPGPRNRGEGPLGFDFFFFYSVPVSRFLAHSWEPVHCIGTYSALHVLWSDIRQIFTSKPSPVLITCHSEHTCRKPWLTGIITLSAYTDVSLFFNAFPSGFSSCNTLDATVLYIRGSVTLPPPLPLQSSLQPLENPAFACMLNERTFLCAWYLLAQNFQSQSRYIKQIPFFLLHPSINNCSLQEWEHSVFSLMQHSHLIQIRFHPLHPHLF